MNSEELSEVVVALHELCEAQAGRIAALEAVSGAIVATLGMSFPPMLEQLARNIDGLADHHRPSEESNGVSAFEAMIDEIQRNIRILQR